MRLIIIIFLLYGLLNTAFPQEVQPYFQTYTSANGLTSSSINSVCTDHNGYLWIATNYGLNKFSGNNFLRFYPSENSTNKNINNNNVQDVLCDSIVTWITMKNGGLSCYFDRPNVFVNYTHVPSDTGSLLSDNINCIFRSKNGKLLLGTDKGLSIFDRTVSRFKNKQHGFADSVVLDIRSIIETKDNVVWLGTNKQGLFYYDKASEVLKINNLPAAMESLVINDFFYDDQEDEIWLATSGGLWTTSVTQGHILSDWKKPFKSLEALNISCIEKNGFGEIWIGTMGNGLFWFDEKNIEYHYTDQNIYGSGLVSNNITDIFFSKDGTAWISTSSGLQSYNRNLGHFPGTKTNIRIDGKLIKARPAGLVLADQLLFSATDKGIWYSDTNFTKVKSLVAYKDKNQLVSFSSATKIGKNIFVTSDNGLYRILNITGTPQLAKCPLLKKWKYYTNKACNDLLSISDAEYCLATCDGRVYTMNIQSGNIDSLLLYQGHEDQVFNNLIKTRLFKCSDQKLLVGTNYCINLYKIISGHLRLTRHVILNPGQKKFSQVLDCYEDDHFFWIGTQGTGLFKFDKDLNLLSNFSVEDGLCDNTINVIIPYGKGNLLLATNRGLSIYNSTENKFQNYYSQQGLFSQEFQPFGKAMSASGILYLSTSEGVMKVKPFEQEFRSQYSFDIRINKLSSGNQTLNRGDLVLLGESKQFDFDYGKNLAISFEVINLLNVHHYFLQYKLNNGKQWHNISAGSELIFDRLKPGLQKLYVKGTTDDNKISLKPIVVTFNIHPLYYQQWWFVTTIVAISAFVIYLLYRYRITQLKKLLKFRIKISQDLHDEIGSTLSGIAMYSHLTKTQIKTDQTIEAEKSLNIIQHSAAEMVDKLNDIVWLINPDQDSLQKLIQRLEEYATDMAMTKNMQVNINVPEHLQEHSLPMESRRNIYLFCKEAINNSVKYSNGTLLELNIEEMDNKLEFSVSDNGKGFDAVMVRRGNGLENMQKRAGEIGAKLTVQSKQDEGCFVSMQLKIT